MSSAVRIRSKMCLYTNVIFSSQRHKGNPPNAERIFPENYGQALIQVGLHKDEPRRRVKQGQRSQQMNVLPLQKVDVVNVMQRLDNFHGNFENVRGHKQDSSALISYIRHYCLIQPNYSAPYNFKKPAEKLLYGQIGQPKLVDQLLKGRTNGFFVEVGAYNGEELTNSLFFEQKRNFSGLLIEAGKGPFKDLITKNRKAFAINACLSLTNYADHVHFAEKGTGGHIKKTKVGRQDSIVECFPMYSIMAAMNRSHIDYWSLDIEGGELGVFRELPWDKMSISVMTVELPEQRKPDIDIIKTIWTANGYKICTRRVQDLIVVKESEAELWNPKLCNYGQRG